MQSRAITRNALIVAVLSTSIALVAGAGSHSAHPAISQPSAHGQAEAPALEVLASEDHHNSHAGANAVQTAHPSMLEILQSAQALADAGLLPAQVQPSMLEILTAVNLLGEARARQEAQAQDFPAPAPAEPRSPVPVPQPAPTPPPAAAAPTASGWYDDAYIAQVLDLVNAHRASAGLPGVAVDARLVQSAAGYAKVLSDRHWFSHTGPDGSTFVQRIEAAGLPFTVPFGEILAWGTASWSPESLVQAWMASPPHRADILSPLYRRAGAGCYFTPADAVTVYCAVDFAG